MKKFSAFQSKVIALPMKNVDTDAVIPAQFLTSTDRTGYGQNLFRRLRDQNPDFAFNLKKYQGAEILASGHNFGCGSSREHAVWALQEWGIKAILAKSFAEIFFNNAEKNGLLLITLAEEIIDEILAGAEKKDYIIAVNLQDQEISLPDQRKISFEYDSFRKHCLLQGLDDINYILSHRTAIERFRKLKA